MSELISPLSSCMLGSRETIKIRIRNYGTDTLDTNNHIIISAKINSELFSENYALTRILVPGDTITYRFTGTSDLSAPGIYNMEISTRLAEDYNYSNDTLKYNIEVFGNPEIDLGNDVVVSASEYILYAGQDFASYLWQNGSSTENFLVDQQGEGLYHVTVTNEHHCGSSDTVRVTLNVTDISVSRILSPGRSCISDDSVVVSLRLKNTGNLPVAAGEKLKLTYLFEGKTPVMDSVLLSQLFMPGDSIDFIFRKKTRVSIGSSYSLTTLLSSSSDIRISNNTMTIPVAFFVSPVINIGEDYSVVAGRSYTLDAGPGYVSYLWNDGSTARTMTINTPGINKCSVLVTDSNGCTAFDEVSVMLAMPDISITEITSPAAGCGSGGPGHVKIRLRNLGNSDIDQSAGIYLTYSINNGPVIREKLLLNSVFKTGSDYDYTFIKEENFNITGQYAITASIEYDSDMSSENNTLSTSVAITESPVFSLNQSDTIRLSGPTTLSGPSGFSAYKWQDGSQASSYEIRKPGEAMYTLEVTANNGCIAKDSVYVIFDLADIGITRVITPVTSCTSNPGTKTVYMEVRNNGILRIPSGTVVPISFSIDNDSPVSTTIQTVSPIEPSGTGILNFDSGFDFSDAGVHNLQITIVYSDVNLSNNTINHSVTVWENPNVEIGGGSDTLKNAILPVYLDAGPGHAAYKWHDNSVSQKLLATTEGLYWVKVTDRNGCYSVDSVYVTSGELQYFPGKIKIYPNPVSEILYLEMELDDGLMYELELYTQAGFIVYKKEFRDIQNSIQEIDVRPLAPGTYFLRLRAGKSKQVIKVIVI